jgi:hypothetical protein
MSRMVIRHAASQGRGRLVDSDRINLHHPTTADQRTLYLCLKDFRPTLAR